jgi:hypothetical protein
MQLAALFRLAFASAPNLQSLTSLHNVTRRSVLQKVRGRAYITLPLLVNTGFQVLFHSPPGVLFTFPSRYYALSVTISYLALGGGPPCFSPGFTCPAILWYRLAFRSFRVRGCHPLWQRFLTPSPRIYGAYCRPTTPESKPSGLGSFPFARRYLGNRCFFLFLRVLRCFSSPGALLTTYLIQLWVTGHYSRRVPPFGYLRINACLRLLVAFRSLPRPSSAYGALASTLRSCSLDFFVALWYQLLDTYPETN